MNERISAQKIIVGNSIDWQFRNGKGGSQNLPINNLTYAYTYFMRLKHKHTAYDELFSSVFSHKKHLFIFIKFNKLLNHKNDVYKNFTLYLDIIFFIENDLKLYNFIGFFFLRKRFSWFFFL